MKAMLLTAVVGLSLAGLVWANCGTCGAGEHAEGEHTHAEVGKAAPVFTATDANGNTQDIAALTAGGKIVVLEWFNPDCPFVKRHYENGVSTMKDLAAKYADKVVWLAVNSSEYADAEFNMTAAQKWDIQYPVIVDQSGQIGRMYGAQTTPHMYIISTDGTLAYAGAIDNNAGGNLKPEEIVNYVDQAISALLAGQAVPTAQTKSYGCSVKYGEQASADAPTTTASGCPACANCGDQG